MKNNSSVSLLELLTIINDYLSESIELVRVFPTILQEIKSYLHCEQVFICYFNPEGEEEIITSKGELLEFKIDNVKSILKNYFQDKKKLTELLKNQYDSSNDLDNNDVTQPLIKSELTLPIVIKIPELIPFLSQDLWGILFIYDYDSSRIWQEKEINILKLLIKQLTLAIERNLLYGQLKLKNQQLEETQLIDNLTQLPNYNSFIDCIEFEWLRLAREQEYLSLIMIDVNIPPNYQKDLILLKIADYLLEIIKRPSDLSARYSDTKFGIILPQTNNEGAKTVAEKIYTLIAETLINDYNIVVTMSVTTCICQPKSDYNIILTTAKDCLKEAIEKKININTQEINYSKI